MNTNFLKAIQRAGWSLVSVTDDAAVAKCPAHGCGLRAKLAEGTHVPQVDANLHRSRLDMPVSGFDQLRLLLRDRREELGLSIHEVEEVAGIAVDFLAKFEKDDPSKLPNFQTAVEWMQALGYEVILRPTEMTPYALRTICDTRAKLGSRQKRHEIDKRRREERA